MNSIAKGFALILAVLLLYIFPITHTFEEQDDISSMVAFKAVTEFVDSVRDKGYVTPTMYRDFDRRLAATGNIFEVQMEHGHKRYTPIYEDPTNQATFKNEFIVDYDNFYQSQIMGVLFPDNMLPADHSLREYRMNIGDFFQVTVRNTNKTNAAILKDFLNNGSSARHEIYIPYGGMVRNEDY